MASEAAIKRIEKNLERLLEQQNEICIRIGKLESRSVLQSGGATNEEVIEYLDQFRANEALGEAALGAWVEVCQDDCLRGGLRTIQMREGMHAHLLAERVKELGGSPKAEIPEAIHNAAMAQSASTGKSDAEKLVAFMTQFPDCDTALKPIVDMVKRLDDDPETQSLLRTICQDERSTLEFLSEACAQLNS
jgi:bacterioferritin (cytochrome b1)